MMARAVLVCNLTILLFVGMFMSIGLRDIRADIIAAWLFDEGSGDVARDSSGNGHHAKLMNGDKKPKWVDESKFGKALKFNVVVDYLDPDTFSITYNNAFTLMLWMYPIHTQAQQMAGRSQEGDDQDGDIRLATDASNHVHAQVYVGAWANLASEGTIELNEWIHLTMTCGKKGLRLYINGELDPVSAAVNPVINDKENNHPALIGCRLKAGGKSTNRHFIGTLDEVCYADEALTEEEINKVMTVGLRTYMAVQPSGKLAATWGDIKTCRLMSNTSAK